MPHRFQCRKSSSNTAEVLIYSFFGPDWAGGVEAKTFAADVNKLRPFDTLDVRFNSDGGDVFEAKAIYTFLARDEATINCHVDGLCASAATIVAMAGSSISMAESATFMIHNPWTFTMGDASRLEDVAAQLRGEEEVLAKIYSDRTGVSQARVREMMAAETWMSAEEALSAGFVTDVVENVKIAAQATFTGRYPLPESVLKQASLAERSEELRERVAQQVALLSAP